MPARETSSEASNDIAGNPVSLELGGSLQERNGGEA